MSAGGVPPDQTEDLSPVSISEQQFERALCHIRGIKRGLIDFLRKPKHITLVNFPIELDDGSVVSLKGNEEVEYDGEVHTAANLYDALKEGYYGKF